MSRVFWIVGAGLVVGLSASAPGQTITPILQSGDNISGIGNVVGVIGVAVDDSGNVLAHAFTDNASIAHAIVDASHTALLMDGQALSQPAGASILDFDYDSLDLSASGISSFHIYLSGTPGGFTVDDEGLYTGLPLSLAVQETTTPCTASGVTSGSNFASFYGPRVNDNNAICFSTTLDDPSVSGRYNIPAIVVVNNTTGAQSVVVKKGDVLPGQTQPVLSVSTYVAFNNSGQTIYGAGTAAAAGLNSVLYLDGTKVAQTGDSSPFPGSPHYTQLGLSTLGVALDNSGNYAFSCQLNSSVASAGIVRNGAPFVLIGDALPAIAPYRIAGLGRSLYAGDNGKTCWIGSWDTTGSALVNGLFVDYALVVQEGVTQINGLRVSQLSGFSPGMYMSKNGRYVAFQATLEDGTEGVYLIDLDQ